MEVSCESLGEWVLGARAEGSGGPIHRRLVRLGFVPSPGREAGFLPGILEVLREDDLLAFRLEAREFRDPSALIQPWARVRHDQGGLIGLAGTCRERVVLDFRSLRARYHAAYEFSRDDADVVQHFQETRDDLLAILGSPMAWLERERREAWTRVRKTGSIRVARGWAHFPPFNRARAA